MHALSMLRTMTPANTSSNLEEVPSDMPTSNILDASMSEIATSPEAPPKKKIKLTSEVKINDIKKQLLVMEEKMSEFMTTTMQGKRDEDVNFFYSLLPHIKQLEPLRKLELRKKMIDLVINAVRENKKQ
ncbi:hypothetical protein FKM82_019231 [Ascaphus truei]